MLPYPYEVKPICKLFLTRKSKDLNHFKVAHLMNHNNAQSLIWFKRSTVHPNAMMLMIWKLCVKTKLCLTRAEGI